MEIKIIETMGKVKDSDTIIYKVSVNCSGCGEEKAIAMTDDICEEVQKYESDVYCKDCSIKKRKLTKSQLKKSGDNFYVISILRPSENHKGNKPLNYRAYLTSERWKQIREQAAENAGGRCQLCNKPGSLHVHHRTYENIGNETMSDLIALCGRCHAKFHDILD